MPVLLPASLPYSSEDEDDMTKRIREMLPNVDPPSYVVNHLFLEAAREWELQKLIRSRGAELDRVLREYAAFPSRRPALAATLKVLLEARIEHLRKLDGGSLGTTQGENLDTVEGLIKYMAAWEKTYARVSVEPIWGDINASIQSYLAAITPPKPPVSVVQKAGPQ